MATRNVYLTQRLDAFIDEVVETGRYGTASEVVREALRGLMLDYEKERRWKRLAQRRAIRRAST